MISRARPVLAWQRFWCPLGSTIHCDLDGPGFLTDPTEHFGKYANPTVSILTDLLPETGPLVLCGEPGIGKSTELAFLRNHLQPSGGSQSEEGCWIAFEEVADWSDFKRLSVESDAWKQWRTGNQPFTLIVDGVDEGLLRIANFVSNLKTLLSEEPVERLRIILACRTAKWPTTMGQDLFALWPATEIAPLYELCPLLRKDALEAARTYGCDPETFLEAVWDRNVVHLASRPITLFFLLDEFRRYGVLPDTHRDLYLRCTKELIREVSPRLLELRKSLGRSSATDQERLDAAKHLACLLLVSGGTAVRVSSGAFQSSDQREISTDEAATGGKTRITADALDEAVESALFTSLGSHRYGFIHRTVAECLASEKLQRLPLAQIRALLCQRDERGEHVVPQLAELAAWVAVSCPEFREHLLRVDPEALLRSDVTRLPNTFKAQLVEAIFHGAREEWVFDPRGFDQFFSALDHPGLSAQLRSVISDPKGHFVARRIALRIATRCRCITLIDCLLERVWDSADIQHLREQAASALEEIIPEDQLHLLEPLARGETKPDPDDSIKGHALNALVPKRWKARDTLAFLTPRTNQHFYGAYGIFLDLHLPKRIEQEDLLPILKWIRPKDRSLGLQIDLNKLEEAAFAMALTRLDDDELAEVVVQIWQRWSRWGWHQLSKESDICVTLETNEGVRRQLAELYLNHPATDATWIHGVFEPCRLLQGSSSLDWLLDQICTAPAARRAAWACAIRRSTNDEHVTAPCWDKLLLRITEIPELAELYEWLRAWNFDEPVVRQEREDWLEEQRRQASRRKNEVGKQIGEIRAGIDSAFERFGGGNNLAWFELWSWLILSDDGRTHEIYTCDVSCRSNWNLISSEQRQQAPVIARAYLLSELCEQQIKQNDTRFYAARCGVWMLRASLAGDLELRNAILNHWLDIIVFNGDPTPEPQHELFKHVYGLSPDRVLQTLSKSIALEAMKQRHPTIWMVAANCWDDRLSNLVLEAIQSSSDPVYVVNALDELAARDLEAALTYCELTLASITPESPSYPVGFFGALANGLIYDINRIWTIAEPYLRFEEGLARATLARLCEGIDIDHRKNRSPLSAQTMRKLYMLICHWFPPSADPPHYSGEMSVWDNVRHIRSSLPGKIAALGTDEACQELQLLAETLPPKEATWIRWVFKDAVVNVRRNLWEPPSLQTIQQLLERSDARLLSSSDNLLELIQESLNRLQITLKTQALPRSEDLWSWFGNGTRRKNFVPKDEDFLSGYVADWLTRDLGPKAGVVVGREVQPRLGARADIIVEAVVPSDPFGFEKFVVVIETKGCWHRDVRTGAANQLVKGYLEEHGWRCGLYLVGWYVCSQWKIPKRQRNQLQSDDLEAAKVEVANLVSKYDGTSSPRKVTSYVLDCTLPTEVKPSCPPPRTGT